MKISYFVCGILLFIFTATPTIAQGKWAKISGLPEDISVEQIDQAGGAIYLCSGNYGIYRSNDSGNTWAQINNDLPSTSGIALAVSPVDPNKAFCAVTDIPIDIGANYGIFYTGNGGNNWELTQYATQEITELYFDPKGETCFALVNQEGIYKNFRGRWEMLHTTNLPNVPALYKIAVSPASERLIWLADENNLYLSKDAGRNWSVINREKFGGQNIISILPGASPESAKVAVLMTEGGQFKTIIAETQNFGRKWSYAEQGYRLLKVTPAKNNSRTLYSYDNIGNIYFSKDSGKNFNLIANIPVSEDVSASSICVGDGFLLLGTRSKGLWKLALDLNP